VHHLVEEKTKMVHLEGSAEGIMSVDARRVSRIQRHDERMSGHRREGACLPCYQVLNFAIGWQVDLQHYKCPMVMRPDGGPSTCELQARSSPRRQDIEVHVYSVTLPATGGAQRRDQRSNIRRCGSREPEVRLPFDAGTNCRPFVHHQGYTAPRRSDAKWNKKTLHEGSRY